MQSKSEYNSFEKRLMSEAQDWAEEAKAIDSEQLKLHEILGCLELIENVPKKAQALTSDKLKPLQKNLIIKNNASCSRLTQIFIDFFTRKEHEYSETRILKAFQSKTIDLAIAKRIAKDLDTGNNIDSLKNSYFNQISFKNDKFHSSLKGILTADAKEMLFRIILLSRESDEIGIAASNAITILNKIGFRFTNRDLSNVKIPGADLSRVLLINTNFENSDLTGVNLSQSNLYFTNFDNALWIRLNLGN